VDDALLVRGLEGFGDLSGDREGVIKRKTMLRVSAMATPGSVTKT
jgi:hypothetical protein